MPSLSYELCLLLKTEGGGGYFMIHVTQQKFIKIDMNLWHVHAVEDNFSTIKQYLKPATKAFVLLLTHYGPLTLWTVRQKCFDFSFSKIWTFYKSRHAQCKLTSQRFLSSYWQGQWNGQIHRQTICLKLCFHASIAVENMGERRRERGYHSKPCDCTFA